MKLLNYTTKIDPDKTATEIARCLSMYGAQAVLTEYDKEGGFVSAISFRIEYGGNMRAFRLPCDYRPVFDILMKDKKKYWDQQRQRKLESDMRSQAVRTAWRIVKDWVEAQMALVETQMVPAVGDIFLPYAEMRDGRTLAEHARDQSTNLLPEAIK